MPNFKSEKLRVNLRLCINRLKLLEKKKSACLSPSQSFNVVGVLYTAEGAMKARREIADYMKNKRTERSRIRVCELNKMTVHRDTTKF